MSVFASVVHSMVLLCIKRKKSALDHFIVERQNVIEYLSDNHCSLF